MTRLEACLLAPLVLVVLIVVLAIGLVLACVDILRGFLDLLLPRSLTGDDDGGYVVPRA